MLLGVYNEDNFRKINRTKIGIYIKKILNKFETFKKDYEDDDNFIEDIICEYSDGEYIDNIDDKDYIIEEGSRLVQLVGPNHEINSVNIVDKIVETSRSDNGFGSTGN